MGHLQLAADLAWPDPLEGKLQDLYPQVVGQRAPIGELPTILVNVPHWKKNRYRRSKLGNNSVLLHPIV